MSITVEVENPQTFDAELLADIVSAATIGDILQRLDEGIGADDEAMKPYSDGYAAKLKREGRSTTVDLTYTGLMKSQIRELSRETLNASSDGVALAVRITFGVGGAGNRNNIAAYNQNIRRWFGLSPKGEKRVGAAIQAGASASRHSTARKGGVVRTRDASGRFLRRQVGDP